MDFAIPRKVKSQLQRVRTPWGGLVGLKSDRITRTILADGQYEWAETAVVAQLLRSGATAIDVGANIGYYTALFRCLTGPRGAVHAFEANPFTAALLRLGMAENGWDDVAVNTAAVAEAGAKLRVKSLDFAVVIADPMLNLGGWALREIADGDWQIEMVALDQYVRDHGIEKLHLLKIDVEGFEARVLEGADATVRRLKPYVFLELRSANAGERAACEAVVGWLEHRDYACCRIVKRPFPHFRAIRAGDIEDKFHFNIVALPRPRFQEFLASSTGRLA